MVWLSNTAYRTGREVSNAQSVYRSGVHMIAVGVQQTPRFVVRTPRVLFSSEVSGWSSAALEATRRTTCNPTGAF